VIFIIPNVRCYLNDWPQYYNLKSNPNIGNNENHISENIPDKLQVFEYSPSQLDNNDDTTDEKYSCVYLEDENVYCELIGRSSESKRGSMRGLLGKRGSMRGLLGKRGSMRGLLGKRGSMRGLLGKRGSMRGLLGKRGSMRGVLGKRGSLRGLLGKRGSLRGLLGKRGSLRGLLGKRGSMRGLLGKREYIGSKFQKHFYDCRFPSRCGLLSNNGEETKTSLRDPVEQLET